MLPLEGLRIIDLTNLLPGPFSTMILLELGAEVIKVERPVTGDPVRSTIPGLFEAINRGKKSIALDLKNADDKMILEKLIEKSDVLIEGFRPGVMKRLGLDKEAVEKLNSGLIYCSISGYGQTGPYKDLPGHDINYLAVAGVMSISGNPKGEPEGAGGIQVADLASSMYAVISILAALQNRLKTEKGAYIDVSMTECALSLMVPRIAEYYGRKKPSKEHFMGRAGYGAFQTKEGKYISLGLVEGKFWHSFCEVVEMPELSTNEAFNSWTKRMEHADSINNAFIPIILQKEQKEWLDILKAKDIPCSPVNFIEDLIDDPHLQYRNAIRHVNDELIVGFPATFDGLKIENTLPIPIIGEHEEEIFGLLENIESLNYR